MADAYIGCAGWSLPRAVLDEFPRAGSHLQRYAARLACAEINSSFYRPHQRATYERWAASVPENFRFAVKMPRAITHDARLRGIAKELDAFLGQANALGEKLGCVLVQLPPSFAFEHVSVTRFLTMLRRRHGGPVAIEPRHASWFVPAVDTVLVEYAVARVAADPAVVAAAAEPGGARTCIYFRLHGSPRMYFSVYADPRLRKLAQRLRTAQATGAVCWCIFDNTAHGGAVPNALRVQSLLQRR